MGSRGQITLREKHPELAEEADGWDPSLVSCGSGQILPWKCSQGHRWNAMVNNRAKGRGCPICAGKQVLIGFNDFKTLHPELASEAVGWDPASVRPGSNTSFLWRCHFGHEWKAKVIDRVKGHGCPVCVGKTVLAGFNDLATTHPDLAQEAFGWDPSKVSKGTHKKFQWLCERGHLFIAGVANRTGFSKTGCPVCVGKTVLAGFNDLATTHPELAKEAFGWDPTTVSTSSGKKVKWQCKFGHLWSAVIASRSSGRGCPVCAGQAVLSGFNDLATTHPDLAEEAFGWDPTTVIAGSHVKLKWVCAVAHEWQASPHSRTGFNKTGCPVCAGKAVLAGFNDLATTHPDLAEEAFGWDPTTVNAGSNPKVEWICELDHRWRASPNSRTGKNKSGCPICANKEVLIGYNDLATANPLLAAEAFEWDPTTVTRSSSKKRKWICQFGHTWNSSVADRSVGSGCPTCSKGGFDPNKPAWFYFIEHFEWNMYQIGITTNPELRLKSHQRIGWSIVELRGPLDGHHIQGFVSAVLRGLT